MTNETESAVMQSSMPVILGTAGLQGMTLYALHLSIQYGHWPATDPAWLLALSAIAVWVPITVQLLAEHLRDKITWVAVAVLAVVSCYFGWHHGANVMDETPSAYVFDRALPFAFVVTLLWLLWLPFVQCRLLEGCWRFDYRTLFAAAWRNKLTLAEAGLFTGLLWLLLLLWAQLFEMLGIGFFEDLFQKPFFAYPVTALAFGSALYLVGSVSRLVTVVLEQVLNVLKWLAVIAGLILGLFTVALALKLPALISTGARAIGAAWLLWLVAVMVLLVNAAYRDGGVARPYPRWIALGVRGVVPLLTIIALTAGYAMYVRIDARGLTVERFWACVVAAAAGVYAFGYACAAVLGRPWMAGIERINIAAALFLIVVIAAALTPVLSPYRLAAASQAQRALEPSLAVSKEAFGSTPMGYLRFQTGRYGRERLAQLARLQDHPRAADISKAARAALARENPWDLGKPVDVRQRLAELGTYPAGRTLMPELIDVVADDLSRDARRVLRDDIPGSGLFIDLDDDGAEEFVLLSSSGGLLYARETDRGWYRVGGMNHSGAEDVDLTASVERGAVRVIQPRWRILRVGGSSFRVEPEKDQP